jgi:probable F420-dependent oxidoreductase
MITKPPVNARTLIRMRRIIARQQRCQSKKRGAIVQVGVTLRNMGPESSRALMADCARAADACGIESLWVTDHVAIPPDDAEGSGGRYVDPLVTLAWLAGITHTIRLGTGVIVLPYHAPLQLARQVAAVQELSGGRLLFGVGVGWMAAEFRALGIDLRRRAADADARLEFFNRCFADDVVEAHGQPFLFRPRPVRPPVLVGGRGAHALRRAARYGDGWLPMGVKPDELAAQRRRYDELTDASGRPRGTISVMTGLPLHDRGRLLESLQTYASAGADRLICAVPYTTFTQYGTAMTQLAAAIAATH